MRTESQFSADDNMSDPEHRVEDVAPKWAYCHGLRKVCE